MGQCVSSGDSNPANKEARMQSKAIDASLSKERQQKREKKLLLLGAGESGKSTVAKQLQIIHLRGFKQEELMNYRPIIHCNVLESIKLLVLAAEKCGYKVRPENEAVAKKFAEISTMKSTEFTIEQTNGIRSLWNDDAIQQAYERRNEFQLPDVAKYLFDNIDRITAPNYIPDQNDCLRCRARTTGIIETKFEFQSVQFRMVDVGGQRSERKKWIHCFQDVTAVIFCVALSEYDQTLFEDENVNRMHESLELFRDTCNSRWFKNTSMILFLNKSDIFQEKISKRDLKCCFPDYTGGCDFLNATQFIENKFLECNKQEKPIYTHITCATNTDNISFVFGAVKDIILTQSLQASGFAM